MDSSSESQNTQQRPLRAKRLDYHALNTGTDSEGDSDEGPRSRSRRRLEVSETSTAFSDDIISPDESASQVLASDADRDPSLSPVIQRKPIPPKSWVWQHFHITELETTYVYKATNKERPDKLIVCSRCSWSTTEAVLQGSSGNLSTHLSSRHGIRKSGAPALTASSDITSFLNRPSRSVAERLEDNILHWIVEESEPFTSVDAPSFKRIFHDLPGIELPLKSASTVKRRLVARFEESRGNLKRELESTCVTIGLSLDVWTSKNNLSILGVVGHWLTPEFVYKERVLEFKELDGPHSGENMAMAVGDLLEELKLNAKLLTITGDNASNNEVMISELYKNLLTKFSTAENTSGNNERRVMRFEGLSSYIRCIAHVLNLIVGDIMSALKAGDIQSANRACDDLRANKDLDPDLSPLARLRIIVLWIDRSPQRRNRWKKLCQVEELPEKIIPYDVSTRWNSTYQMLKESLESRKQIERFMVVEAMGLPSFTATDWDQLRQLKNVLAKFDEFTRLVSKSKPQLSLSIALYYELEEFFQDAKNRDGLFKDTDLSLVRAVEAGLKKYEKYFGFADEIDVYYIAMILDPRFKCELLKQEIAVKADSSFLIEQMRELLHKLYLPEHNLQPQQSFAQPSDHPTTSTELRLLRKIQAQSRYVSDIDRYFDDAVISVANTDGNENWLFEWWNTHKGEYPQMARAARDFLPLPASEVACERLFSQGRDLLGLRRHRMNGETMRLLTLLKSSYMSE